jgi:uncharacterized protein YbjT (DUF2867 family)
MRVLVTGGTGVVGTSAVTALVQHGHVVTLFSRHATLDASRWTQGVHAVDGSVTDASTLSDAAGGCEAVLHLAGIVEESGEATFDRVNVQGTRHVVEAARRAGVRRLVYVSSLGAQDGRSGYHRSKRAAEEHVRAFRGEWVILRPGNVFGPGDEQISLLLRMVRTLPAIPVVGGGTRRFQPIWHEDLADVLARAVDRPGLDRAELDLAGFEHTSQNDLIERLQRITGRTVARVPVPEILSGIGARLASAVGIDIGLNESQLTMLTEGNEIPAGGNNAILTHFGVAPTGLDDALKRLADAQDESFPGDGVGPMRRKRFWADITGTTLSPEALLDRVRERFASLLASFVDASAEPDTAQEIAEGATLTLSLPLRGHMQVRVAENEERLFTLVTLQGHPLAGAVRVLSEARGSAVRFEIQVFERAATAVDLVLMRTLGERLQESSWREMIGNVVRLIGGRSGAIEEESESLDEAQASRIEEWLRTLVMTQKREEVGI